MVSLTDQLWFGNVNPRCGQDRFPSSGSWELHVSHQMLRFSYGNRAYPAVLPVTYMEATGQLPYGDLKEKLFLQILTNLVQKFPTVQHLGAFECIRGKYAQWITNELMHWNLNRMIYSFSLKTVVLQNTCKTFECRSVRCDIRPASVQCDSAAQNVLPRDMALAAEQHWVSRSYHMLSQFPHLVRWRPHLVCFHCNHNFYSMI